SETDLKERERLGLSNNDFAPISRQPLNWLPGIELFGEGIFIQLNEKAVCDWERRNLGRYAAMAKRLDQKWIGKEMFDETSPRFVLLHTFSHLLIRQLTAQCGYATASIKEKIYSTYPGTEDSMSGVLIYTSATDTDGSLGGLVREGYSDRIGNTLRNMLQESSWCSNDPICIESLNQGYKGLNYAEACLNDYNRELVTVSTYHALLQKALNNPAYFNKSIEEISNAFLKSDIKSTCFDCLVIDEGQDLMQTSALEVMEKYVINGLANGEWVMFLDPNQNIFNATVEYDFALEYLREAYNPVVFSLNHNCRNTEQIGRRTSVLTLVPAAKHMRLSGPKVFTKSYSNSMDLSKKVRTELASLFSGGISSDDVVMLSHYKLCNSNLAAQTSMCNLEIVARDNIDDFGKHCLNYFTIQSFKGLESKIVFLIDVDGFESSNERMLNYVAMSRAMISLYVFYDEALNDEYHDMVDRGQDLLY
ncbi:MAG: ATP-binding domain-containing protein, partial [Oscillospiraceae bacterium]|nr:ATP-binding domain-containing protein [Oscillospiraceae bacterium]